MGPTGLLLPQRRNHRACRPGPRPGGLRQCGRWRHGCHGPATVLAGLNGVVIAAAAGCSGLMGSIGGRELAAICFSNLSRSSTQGRRRRKSCSRGSASSRRSASEAPVDLDIQEAYQELGLAPNCPHGKLCKAFRRSVLQSHPDSASGSQERFLKILQAMAKIRASRELELQHDFFSDAEEVHDRCDLIGFRLSRPELVLHSSDQASTQLASFIGATVAQQSHAAFS